MNKKVIPIIIFSIFLTIGSGTLLLGIFCLLFCLIEGFNLSATISVITIFGIGLILCLIGGIGLFVIIKNKKIQTLKQTVTRISANYIETIINKTFV